MKRLILLIAITAPFLSAMDHVPGMLKDMPCAVGKYLESLPRISVPTSDDPRHKAAAIVDYLLVMGGYVNKGVHGREALLSKVLECIAHDASIIRCIPAFPVATENPDKIPFAHDKCFTMADFVALLTRNHISREIAKIHKPGSCSVIYWEPQIHDLNEACIKALGHPVYSPERIAAYQNTLKAMVALFEPYVSLGKLDIETITRLYREKYVQMPIETNQAVVQPYEAFWKKDLDTGAWLERSERILFAQKRQQLERNIASIREKSFEDCKQLPIFNVKIKSLLGARAHVHQVAKQLALLAYQGSKRMAALMEREIQDYHKQIRESVRPDYSSVEKKIGTPVIYHADGTAWHRVLVINAQGMLGFIPHYVELVPFEQVSKLPVKYYKVGNNELAYIDEEQELAYSNQGEKQTDTVTSLAQQDVTKEEKKTNS